MVADIEIRAVVKPEVIDAIHDSKTGEISLKVGVDIFVFPNRYNIVVLEDKTGLREPVETQCNGFYNPETQNRKAGAIPFVRLTLDIQELPEDLQTRLINSSPKSYT